MAPEPRDEMRGYTGSGLLDGRRALVTGGDSGIGRATAVAFAKEGADVAITYLEEDEDARHTAGLVEAAGRRCVTFGGDLAEERHCREVVRHTVRDLDGAATQRSERARIRTPEVRQRVRVPGARRPDPGRPRREGTDQVPRHPSRVEGRLDLPRLRRPHPGRRHGRRRAPPVPLPRVLAGAARPREARPRPGAGRAAAQGPPHARRVPGRTPLYARAGARGGRGTPPSSRPSGSRCRCAPGTARPPATARSSAS